jgi:hypothetical protein
LGAARRKNDTYQTGNINTLLLQTTAHGEVLVKGVEVVLGVALGHDTEQLDVVQDLVLRKGQQRKTKLRVRSDETASDTYVESKVIAGNDINASSLLDLPVLQTETLALGEELIAGGLARPVGLGGLLEVTELAHAREAQNGAVGVGVSIVCCGQCVRDGGVE